MADELSEVLIKFVLCPEENVESTLDLGDMNEGTMECGKSLIGMIIGEKLWNLPLQWFSKSVVRKIGSIFLDVKDVIISQIGGKEGRHVKLQVLVDLAKPLLHGTTITFNGISRWVYFKYDKCPDFLYRREIGRDLKNCNQEVTFENKKEEL
ncbi:hypothetical protein ACH5RR_032045 [Cinchona calisaya]|uniref:DUF4283 domain-containing protein n=1 Tax=Cinchona calisaya TaxID=153742 RepID=A0ABD2YI20_9GENT